ncbi:hypothetical protein KAU32_11205 [bacterium]|nr:hypothetical protein [bacterium]
MKLTVFYSWQSDLPNNTNRGFIENCLEKALKRVYKNNSNISEYIVESDSRDESGTPNIVDSIFTKINNCDVFVADISIINKGSRFRKTPNPNVLIELGYASNIIGWKNILSVFNCDSGKIEDLPFDLRHRKPIVYSVEKDKAYAKQGLTYKFEKAIQKIIDDNLSRKKYFYNKKFEIDLELQAIIFDILKIIYFTDTDNLRRLNYTRFLSLDLSGIQTELEGHQCLGFQLYKNQDKNISEFKEFFGDPLEMHFFNNEQKDILAIIIMILSKIWKIFHSVKVFEETHPSKKYTAIEAHKMNSDNPPDSYILLEGIDENMGIVKEGGTFSANNLEKLTMIYKIREENIPYVAKVIQEMIYAINEWIRITGGYFIINPRRMSINKK